MFELKTAFRIIVTTLAFSDSTQVFSDWKPLEHIVTMPKVSNTNFSHSVFHNNQAIPSGMKSLSLTSLLKSRGIFGPTYKLKLRDVSRPNTDNITTETYDFSLNGVDFCEHELLNHTMPNGETLLIGDIPEEAQISIPDVWPSIQESFELVSGSFAESPSATLPSISSQKKCFVVRDGHVLPGWQMVFEISGLSYRAIASNQDIYRIEPRFFEITAKTKTYPHNILETELQTNEIDDLTKDNVLSTKWFFIEIDSSNSSNKEAKGTDNNFFFTPPSSSFDQTSIFTNAHKILSWYQSIGYTEFGNFPIRLSVHALTEGDPNNAFYNPSNTSSGTIYIGDGDGAKLKNLATDADVVMHEFGHHVIFRKITSTTGESLVLHEGIADFFTFAKTNDTCLGESICPTGNKSYCGNNQCLRTADNKYVFGSKDLPFEAHLRSQFISGFLWDLSNQDKIDLETVAKTTLKAVDLLSANSGYKDLVIALLHGDKLVSSGVNCQKIYDRATARGLGEKISDFSCDNLPAITTITGNKEEESGKVESKSSGGSQLCGVLAGTESNHLMFILFAAPLLLILRSKKKA